MMPKKRTIVPTSRAMAGADEGEADKREDLLSHMGRYSWELVIDPYDEKVEKLAAVLPGQ